MQTIEDTEFSLDNPWLCLKALQASYPDIVGDMFFDTEVEDWCIKVRGTTVYWAHGRLLKKEHIKNWKKWVPYISYLYPQKIPNPQYFTEPLVSALAHEALEDGNRNELSPNYTFHQLVYEGKTEKDMIKQLRKINFLGKDVWIHKQIVQPLLRVQNKIYQLKKKEKNMEQFLKTIKACWGFNWRVIANSGKLSNHSWGIAVDIVPANNKTAKIYWLWEAKTNELWMKLAPDERWAPPKSVIDIFESEGFIWGGRWELWDNMHFEYRPELLYIQNFLFLKGEYVHNPYTAKTGNNDAGLSVEDIPAEPAGNLKTIYHAVTAMKLINKYIEKLEVSAEGLPDNN